MAQSQEELQELLSELPGVTKVYFQKPGNLTLVPPYLVYEVSDEYVMRADDMIVAYWNQYTVTLVTRDQEDPIRGFLRGLPHSSFNRRFVSGGLYHFVYSFYF